MLKNRLLISLDQLESMLNLDFSLMELMVTHALVSSLERKLKTMTKSMSKLKENKLK